MNYLNDEELGDDIRIGTAFLVDDFGPATASALLMLASRSTDNNDLVLLQIGGHKRGSVLLVLPQDAYSSDHSVSRNWLVENWNQWVDVASNVTKVRVISDVMLIFEGADRSSAGTVLTPTESVH